MTQPPYSVPIVREVGWASGAQNLAYTGFDTWTVQPVTSRCTDYVIPHNDFQVYSVFYTELKQASRDEKGDDTCETVLKGKLGPFHTKCDDRNEMMHLSFQYVLLPHNIFGLHLKVKNSDTFNIIFIKQSLLLTRRKLVNPYWPIIRQTCVQSSRS